MSQLDKIYKKEKRGKYTNWAIGIVLGFVAVGLAYLQVWLASAVILGVSCLWFYRAYKKSEELAGNICLIAQVNPKRKNPETGKEEDKPERVEDAAEILPIVEYIDKKHNPHVLLVGASGTRKTTTMNFIIKKRKETKIILNFKAGDLHLKTGLRVIDVSKNAPNPFSDVSAYNSAFETAYHIVPERRAYMATQSSPVLNESVRHSKNFGEQIRFLEREGSDVALGLLNQVRPLVIDSSTLISLDLSKDVVLDFSGFEFDVAKVFYAELILNQIWNILKRKRYNVLIIIDEAHHILGVPTTKINDFLKEGRSLGIAVYCSTQGWMDVADGIRSNFATKLVFKTDDSETLNQLSKIPSANLNYVSHFAVGEFTDVGFPKLDKFVPIFYLAQNKEDLDNIMQIEMKIENQEKIEWKKEEVEPQVVIMPTISGGSVTIQDREESLRDNILAVLDKNEESLAISRVANALYKNESARAEKNKLKLVVNDEINKLVKEEVIDKQTLVCGKGKAEKHVFRKDENLSKFHVTLQKRSVKLLGNNNIPILGVADHQGIQGEDISLDNCVIECETGLKESLGSFDKKVTEHVKPVIIVVPNNEQKERYSYLPSVSSGKAKVVLLPELIQAIKEFEKK